MFDLASIDWSAIVKIVGIDIMLGVDNAIVIALACASLPAAMRNKAVILGTAGAVILRAILLVFAGFFMGLPWVKLLAGAYLLYIGFKLLMENGDEHEVASADHIFGAVKTIIVADFMMSLDNVLAVVGASQTAGEHATGYAIAGIVLSIPVIVFGAQGIMKLMDRFPIIITAGGMLLGWIAGTLAVTDPALQAHVPEAESMRYLAGGLGALLVLLVGTALARRTPLET